MIGRIRNAIEDGEILTVTYSGGHSPGAKRRILPIRIAGQLLYARSGKSMAIKTYHLNGIGVVEDDFPAPWAEEINTGRQRTTRIDPTEYFAHWAYRIEKALWPALGVSLREYVDKEKSAALRKAAKNGSGITSSTGATVKFLAYAVGDPPVLDFHEGDLFFSSCQKLPAIQVVAKRKLIEVHEVDISSGTGRRAYQLIDTELATWLCCGCAMDHARIDAAQSYSDVLRFSIVSD